MFIQHKNKHLYSQGIHQYSEHWFKNFKWHKILSMHEALSWPPNPLLLTHQRTGSQHSLAAHSSTGQLFQETVCHIYHPGLPCFVVSSNAIARTNRLHTPPAGVTIFFRSSGCQDNSILASGFQQRMVSQAFPFKHIVLF